MTMEEFEGAKKQAEAKAKGLKCQESLRRHAELGLAASSSPHRPAGNGTIP